MTWFIGQSIVVIAAAFLLGILVGWLIWGRMWRPKRAEEPAEAEPEPVAAEEPTPEPEPGPEPVPVLVAAEPVAAAATFEPVAAQAVAAVATLEPETPDDLERIEGIGPKMAGALHEAGIRTYTQLAAADEATLRHAIESHGMRFAPSIVTWGRQAQLLADGDEEGFADLTRRLVAGRDEGRE